MTDDLFPDTAAAPEPDFVPLPQELNALPELLGLAVQRVHGAPAGWRWVRSEIINPTMSRDTPRDRQYYKVEGGVYKHVMKSGKRVGLLDFRKPEEGTHLIVVITGRDIDDARAAWEKETGKCYQCAGTGQEACGCNVKTGHRFRQCRECGGTGRSKA